MSEEILTCTDEERKLSTSDHNLENGITYHKDNHIQVIALIRLAAT